MVELDPVSVRMASFPFEALTAVVEQMISQVVVAAAVEVVVVVPVVAAAVVIATTDFHQPVRLVQVWRLHQSSEITLRIYNV